MPVLGNILLDATADQLRLCATNREVAITCWIPADVDDIGATTIPARLLTEFVNSLPPEQIDMELSVRTQTLHLSCARFEANMKGIVAGDFPLIMTAAQVLSAVEDGVTITQASLPLVALRNATNRTVFAASTDENRPTLTGVEFELSGDCVQLAATDGATFWTKRFDRKTDHLIDFGKNRGKVITEQGRYKAYMMPVFYRHALSVSWYVFGERSAIADILATVTHIGKKPAQGEGRINRWTVEPTTHDYSVYGASGLPMRSIPAKMGVLYGVRPSYWYHKNQTLCVLPS